MATVNMSPSLIRSIKTQMEDSVLKDHGNIPHKPRATYWPEVGDYLYSNILSDEAEDKIRKSLPEGAKLYTQNRPYVNLCVPPKPEPKPEKVDGTTADDKNTTTDASAEEIAKTAVKAKSMKERALRGVGSWGNKEDHYGYLGEYLVLSKERLMLSEADVKDFKPGLKSIIIKGHEIRVTIDADTVANIPCEKTRKYFSNIVEWKHKADDAVREARKAGDDIEAFLNNFTTLQQAVEKFGPSLLDFVPIDCVNKYKAEEVAKKRKRVKKEKVDVDVSWLVAHAVSKKLQLNNTIH